ncbi:hypothetical protein QZM81_21265 [Burkholderia cepacia]|uniref:hypothetical protein n=1 Tax=Burkholderia cepacia TaxID=292 RepID=UPI002653A2C4|nr:hypothetical protein [Burkholderia cepacia]MDN7858331.1 hypothetical protein [Burkholderia cepacia]
MNAVSQFIVSVGGALGVIVAILAAVGFIFKQSLAAWLTKRLSKELEEKAEKYKHELSREMEAYKNELSTIQTVKRFKIEARKAVADRLMDKRLEAAQVLSSALNKVPSWVLSQRSIPPESRVPTSEYLERMTEFSDVLDKNTLYVDLDFPVAYRAIVTDIFNMTDIWDGDGIIDTKGEAAKKILADAAALVHAIDKSVKVLPETLVNEIFGSGA